MNVWSSDKFKLKRNIHVFEKFLEDNFTLMI